MNCLYCFRCNPISACVCAATRGVESTMSVFNMTVVRKFAIYHAPFTAKSAVVLFGKPLMWHFARIPYPVRTYSSPHCLPGSWLSVVKQDHRQDTFSPLHQSVA